MREDLSVLRTLARNNVEDAEYPSDRSVQLPAAHLADQVENLFRIIEPRGLVTDEGSDACSAAPII